MKKKTIYRNVFIVEVLSEYEIDEEMSLVDIANEGETGSFSIATKNTVVNKQISGIKAAKAMKAQGSDPEFFQMDEKGNDLESDDDLDN